MPQEIYSTHRANSSKCPNNKNNTSSNSQHDVIVNSVPYMKNESPNDTSIQRSDEYISNHNSSQNSPINQSNDEESPIIIDNNAPSDKNSDSDDDSSIYTNAHTFDESCCKWMDRK
jgi:hypothetical protein